MFLFQIKVFNQLSKLILYLGLVLENQYCLCFNSQSDSATYEMAHLSATWTKGDYYYT